MIRKEQGGTTAEEQQQVATPEAAATTKTPTGPVMLQANTRKELAAKFAELKASTKDATISTGAVGMTPEGTFVQLVTVTPTKK
jgi:hypothetical protein